MKPNPGWLPHKIRYSFKTIGSGTTPETTRTDYFDGDVPWLTSSELRESLITSTGKTISRSALSDYSALRVYPAGSLAIAMYGATMGRLGILGLSATVNQACLVLAHPTSLDTKFTFYALLAQRENILRQAEGGGQQNLNAQTISGIAVIAPDLAAQKQVAGYLDTVTAEIDSLIRKKQRLIELLDQKRAALISRAVTQGLAGRETDWTAGRLGRFIRLQRGFDITGAEFVTGSYPVISSGGPSGSTDTPQVKGPGVIVGRKGTVGTVYYCETDYWPHDTTLFVQQFRNSIPRFVYYYLVHLALKRFDVGAANPTINRNHVHPERVFWPDRDSQKAIAACLDSELMKLSDIVPAVNTAISLLREYRSALITAAVTGQLDIHEHERRMEALA